jgi:hypothetical protein
MRKGDAELGNISGSDVDSVDGSGRDIVGFETKLWAQYSRRGPDGFGNKLLEEMVHQFEGRVGLRITHSGVSCGAFWWRR